jgi:hypothetical protein
LTRERERHEGFHALPSMAIGAASCFAAAFCVYMV